MLDAIDGTSDDGLRQSSALVMGQNIVREKDV